MGFNPMHQDMGFLDQMYYVWFEWSHALSSSIVGTKMGGRKGPATGIRTCEGGKGKTFWTYGR